MGTNGKAASISLKSTNRRQVEKSKDFGIRVA